MSKLSLQKPPTGGFLFSDEVPVRGLWRNGHVQTIATAYVPSQAKAVEWQRWREDTPDGDFVDFDALSALPGRNTNTVLIVFHGLEGSSGSHYAHSLGLMAQARDWHTVVPHFRGCSGEPNRAPRAYHSGDADEIAWMLGRVRARYPAHRLLAVGVSLGGNALMRWAGLQGAAAAERVHAVASLCSPLNLGSAGRAIDVGINRHIYAKHFLGTMKRKAVVKFQQFPRLFDLQAALQAQSLAAFDNVFTAPIHGYATVQDYWARASAAPVLPEVRVPALCINSHNDPFVPLADLPHTQAMPCVQWALPRWGGHVGFLQRQDGCINMNATAQAMLDWLDRPTVAMCHG